MLTVEDIVAATEALVGCTVKEASEPCCGAPGLCANAYVKPLRPYSAEHSHALNEAFSARRRAYAAAV